MADLADRLYERVLVLRCQAGDDAAFAELVGRYQPRLRYYLRKMLGDADAAAGALQEGWFDASRGLPRLRAPGASPAWVYRLARDRAYRALRRRGVRPAPLDEADLAEPAGEEPQFSTEDVGRVH